MEYHWPAIALEFEKVVSDALRSIDGVNATRRAERDPSQRAQLFGNLVQGLGISDLVMDDPDGIATSVLVVRAFGHSAAAWPIVEQLAVPAADRDRIDGLYLHAHQPRRLSHLDLLQQPVSVDVVDGIARTVKSAGPLSRRPLDPFGFPVTLGGLVDVDVERAVGNSILLTSAWVSGAMARVVDQVSRHAVDRRQFGQPLVKFGAVQWLLSDLSFAFQSCWELTTYTAMLVSQGGCTMADLFALRLQMIESARTVLSSGHQVLGANGLCEEHDVAVIDRHVQPQLFRPFGHERTVELLTDRIAVDGFDAIHPIRPGAAVTASLAGTR